MFMTATAVTSPEAGAVGDFPLLLLIAVECVEGGENGNFGEAI